MLELSLKVIWLNPGIRSREIPSSLCLASKGCMKLKATSVIDTIKTRNTIFGLKVNFFWFILLLKN